MEDNNKELCRVPRPLTQNQNFELVEKLYSLGGSVAFDLIVYLSNLKMKDLFGESWFSIHDFCDCMGYSRFQLQKRMSKEDILAVFGEERPKYLYTNNEGKVLEHPIETWFECALFKLGQENITLLSKENGTSCFKFVQLITKFEIKTNFDLKKKTKRLYKAELNTELKECLFRNYNLVELRDYKQIPNRTGYRYFYLLLCSMIPSIIHKKQNNLDPSFTMTVDQLCNVFKIEASRPNNKKIKIERILSKLSEDFTQTKFQYSFVRGENQKYAYTVKFEFADETIAYFDEKKKAIFLALFRDRLIHTYIDIMNGGANKIYVGRGVLAEKIRNDNSENKKFMNWFHSDQNKAEKDKEYNRAHFEVFGEAL